MGISNPYVILALIALLAGAGYQGYQMGHNACEAAHNDAELERIAEGERLMALRVEAEKERDELARQLEIEANEDPIVVTQCLGPSRVRRLNKLAE
jgi:hypothetical protein